MVLGLAAVVCATFGFAGRASEPRQPYIVVLTSSSDAPSVAREHGIDARRQYRAGFEGFSADLTAAQHARLLRDPRVRGVAPSRRFAIAGASTVLPGYAPAMPSGVNRIDAEHAPIIDDVGIAVIDTGVEVRAELRVQQALTFLPTGDATDEYGHGTHVAGSAAANTMASAFRGVAPRAPLWSLKVFDASGQGDEDALLAAIDWLTANAASTGIRVANLSLAAPGGDTGNCGVTASVVVDPLHLAICQAAAAGVVFVAAAGNGASDAAGLVPAAYPEVLAVSNLGDLDGRSGALAGSIDDQFYGSSGFGAVVDLAAPGTGILSTVPVGSCALCADTGYTYLTGTSMAVPHVSGAMAQYIAAHPGVSTAAAPGALSPAALAVVALGKAQSGACGFTGDPDAFAEPLVYVGLPAHECGTLPTPDNDADGLPNMVEPFYGTDVEDPDTDADHCSDWHEVQGREEAGGGRDPLNPWDFADVPVPALTVANPGGARNGAVTLADALAAVFYVGSRSGGPPNLNGVDYDTDLNANGIADGQEYDRTPSRAVSAAPNGAVTLQDALVIVNQAGDNCAAPPP